jgi:hypothetical protein
LNARNPRNEARMPGPRPPTAAAATTTTRNPKPLKSGVVASRTARKPRVDTRVPAVATP